MVQENKPSLREQVEEMNFFFDKGLPEAITVERFPEIPLSKLATAKFWCYDNLIGGLANALNQATDNELKDKFAVLMTQMAQERDRSCLEILEGVAGEADGTLMSQQAYFRQPIEFSRALEIAVEFGLEEQLNEKNFPALRALTTNEKALLILRTIQNRRKVLEVAAHDLRNLGFTSKDDANKGLEQRLNDEINRLNEQYTALLDQHLKSVE